RPSRGRTTRAATTWRSTTAARRSRRCGSRTARGRRSSSEVGAHPAREGLLGYLRAATLLRMVPPPVAEAADPTDDATALRAENEFLREQLAAVTDIGIALSAERDLRSLLET